MAMASQKPQGSPFRVGDLVRIGVAEIMPAGATGQWEGAIDGAEGIISDITRNRKTMNLQFHVSLNQSTIDRLPEEYLRVCHNRRLQPYLIVLNADQLEHHDWSSHDPPLR